jgi:hypothetical protein
MPATTQCNQCGIVLNVPDHALGKRLKCPHCGARFGASPGGDRSAASSFLLEEANPLAPTGTAGHRPPSSAEALPTVPGDIRETFDAPLLNEVSSAAKGGTATGTKPAAGTKPVADARALFDDGPRNAARRPTAAEARSKARRCPTCGGVVPVGMSLCSSCGLDLETGTRVVLDDDMAPVAAPRGPSLPLAVSILGGISFLGSLVLTIVTVSLWLRGFEGYQYFAPICIFGVYAAVQFLRRKSVRLLLMALTFGVAIDVVALVAMPIYRANAETAPIERTIGSEPAAGSELVIPSVVEKLDTQSLTWGIGLIVVYASVAIYLTSPAVRRHFS